MGNSMELNQLKFFDSQWPLHRLELEKISSEFPNLNRSMVAKVYDIIKHPETVSLILMSCFPELHKKSFLGNKLQDVWNEGKKQ